MSTVCQRIQSPLFFWRLRVHTSLVIIFYKVSLLQRRMCLFMTYFPSLESNKPEALMLGLVTVFCRNQRSTLANFKGSLWVSSFYWGKPDRLPIPGCPVPNENGADGCYTEKRKQTAVKYNPFTPIGNWMLGLFLADGECISIYLFFNIFQIVRFKFLM